MVSVEKGALIIVSEDTGSAKDIDTELFFNQVMFGFIVIQFKPFDSAVGVQPLDSLFTLCWMLMEVLLDSSEPVRLPLPRKWVGLLRKEGVRSSLLLLLLVLLFDKDEFSVDKIVASLTPGKENQQLLKLTFFVWSTFFPLKFGRQKHFLASHSCKKVQILCPLTPF